MQNKLKKTKILVNKKSVKSIVYDECYFNSEDGVGESKYVFLEANNLKERFKFIENFVLAELGFGTGLNFLLTSKLWSETKTNNSLLHYISLEKNPLTKKQMSEIYNIFPSLKGHSTILIKNLPKRTSGIHEIFFKNEKILLTLVYNDFSYINNLNFMADTWFLDGFSPKKNRTAWTQELIKTIFKKTKNNGTFSTFTSSSSVQKKLNTAGFEISKQKGFLSKREMIVGSKKRKLNKSFLIMNDYKKNVEPVAIIGAGVTGCSIAYSLKKRNIDCFIVDKSQDLGGGASGNLIAFQLPKLTLDESPYGIFSLRSYFYSRNLAKHFNVSPPSKGVIVFPGRDREIIKFYKLLKMGWEKKLLYEYSGEFSNYSEVSHHFPDAGIVDTKKFLKHLSSNVKFYNGFKILRVEEGKGQKKLISECGKSIKAKSVVWANGFEMKDILKKEIIIPVSGQVTYLKANEISNSIDLNFSYGKFFSQSYRGLHQTGSTFSRTNFENSKQNDLENIEQLPTFIKEKFNISLIKSFYSRLSVRASTKDRLPFFGKIDDNNEYFIGGMGSWGFVQAPFLSEILVRKILNEPMLIENFVLKNLDIINKK